MTIILHPFEPSHGKEPISQTFPELMWSAHSGFKVLHWPCSATNDLAVALGHVWRTDDIILLVDGSPVGRAQLQELAGCPAALCSVPSLYSIPYHSHGDSLVPAQVGDRYATVTGHGCLKVGRALQDDIKVPPHLVLENGSVSLSELFRDGGNRIHLHWNSDY